MRFAKGHGTENDFVVLPDPDGSYDLTAAAAARLCDRRAGIGGDGVLRVVRTAALAGPAGTAAQAGSPVAADEAEWFMDYRNADGSIAEMCGNGLRVFARYLAAHGLAAGPEFTVATRSGPRHVILGPGGDVTVEMGAVSVLGPGRAVVDGEEHKGLRITVGNPHLACVVERDLAGFSLARPPELDPAEFPGGGNVELVRVTGAGAAAMRVYERGSGETRSCGTGAVAAAVAAAQVTGSGPGAWEVTVPGGRLGVRVDAGAAWLTGPAVIVAEGEIAPAWLGGAQVTTGAPAGRPSA